jgi:tripartite ATP-independent transporter DctM subunit
MMAVLGTIYLGVATPTEAAALGAFATVVMGFVFGTLTLKRLMRALINSIVSFGAIALIMVGAAMLTQVISILGLPMQLTAAVADLEMGKYAIFLAVVIIYIVLGCFFDGLSVMLMTLPLTFPMMMAAGFDPVWYGIAVTILIEIGMITPPVGINLFVLSAISKGDVSVAEAARETLPYWILMLVCLGVFTAFPEIITFLPNSIMN